MAAFIAKQMMGDQLNAVKGMFSVFVVVVVGNFASEIFKKNNFKCELIKITEISFFFFQKQQQNFPFLKK